MHGCETNTYSKRKSPKGKLNYRKELGPERGSLEVTIIAETIPIHRQQNSHGQGSFQGRKKLLQNRRIQHTYPDRFGSFSDREILRNTVTRPKRLVPFQTISRSFNSFSLSLQRVIDFQSESVSLDFSKLNGGGTILQKEI